MTQVNPLLISTSPPLAGTTMVDDINSAIEAVMTQNSGPSAPSETRALQIWADTSQGTYTVFWIRNITNTAWIRQGVYVHSTSQFYASGTLISSQIIDTGSSYSAPAYASLARWDIFGAGGAGGGAADTTGGGSSSGYGGNAGDSCDTGLIDVSVNKDFTFSLGAGGVGVLGGNGTDGGPTTLTHVGVSAWTIPGGLGGFVLGPTTATRSTGSNRTNGPATVPFGTLKKGERGEDNFVADGAFSRGGEGGSSPKGQGGAANQSTAAQNGNNASGPGGGGGGALTPVPSSPRTGGNGGDGELLVEVYA